MTPAVLAQEPRTIAVIPFTNITADASRDWIGVGIAETIGTDLRGADGIDVVGRVAVDGAVANLGGADSGSSGERVLFEAARELGADFLLAGGYQQLGARLRLTARLIDVQSETAVEAFKVDGLLAELFEMQDRLAEHVREAVDLLDGGPAAARRRAARGATAPAAGPGLAGRHGNGNAPGPPGGNGGNGGAGAVASGGLRLGGGGGAPRALPAPARREGVGGQAVSVGQAAPVAQAGPGAGFAVGNRPVVQAHRTTEPPTIDGRLDDVVWRDAVLITDFTQTNPVEGAPPTERTEAWIAYDADHLYFAFYAHYANPEEMRANRVDRDHRRGATTGSR